MGRKAERTIALDAAPEHLAAAVAAAFADVGATSVQRVGDGLTVTGRLGTNVWSWGEQLTARVDPGGTLHLASQCVFPLQFFDWGKNNTNLNDILRALQRRMGPAFRPRAPARP